MSLTLKLEKKTKPLTPNHVAQVINESAPNQTKTALAKSLGISRQMLYYQPKLPSKDELLKIDIEKVLKDNKRYGHRRIAIDLNVNKKRVLRVMKKFNIKTKRVRKKPDKPKDNKQKPEKIPNLLWGTKITKPNQVWVSDFTYLPFYEKFVYLATIMDLYTREIKAWEISTRHNSELVIKTLNKASSQSIIPDIIHSDQGSEYRDQKYLKEVKNLNIKISMSEKASPWQNGYQESFYSEFKLELGHPEAYPNLGELIEAIGQQIYYYNNRRIHGTLKCAPTIFAQRYFNNEEIQLRKKLQVINNLPSVSKLV